MADGEQNPAIPRDHELAPVLQQVLETFQTPEGQRLAATVLPIIQRHVNLTNVADANQQVGQQVVANVADTKNTLVDLAKRDPTAASMAIEIAPHLVAGIVGHSGLDRDQMEATHADLTGHIQSEIARAAVTRMAEIHDAPARQLLTNLGDYLEPEDHRVLGQYIDTMQTARQMDQAAALSQANFAQNLASQRQAFAYGQKLLDPRTEQAQPAPDFVSGLMANNNIRAADRMPLMMAYNNLRANGDPTASDPHIVRGLVGQIADPNVAVPSVTILQHVGNGLRYVDAQMLHSLALGRTPAAQAWAGQLAHILDGAASELTSTASAAHNAAYGRFVNWLLPSIRAGGSIDPQSENYLLANKQPADFGPRHEDIVPAAPAASRPSLASIFGGAHG